MAEREFEMLIPKTDNSGNQVSEDFIANVVREVSDRFEGSTLFGDVAGCYYSSKANRVMCEENILVSAVRKGTMQQIQDDRQFMSALAEKIGVDLGQESIFFQQELDTKTRFVPGDLRDTAYPQYRSGRSGNTEGVLGRIVGTIDR